MSVFLNRSYDAHANAFRHEQLLHQAPLDDLYVVNDRLSLLYGVVH